MATGSAIVAGAKMVGGVAGGISKQRDSDSSLGSQESSMQQGIDTMEKYFGDAIGTGEDALAYAQGLMDDWESTFGGIEQNLSDYYANLDPEKYAQSYKSDLNANIDKQLGQMNEQMAASGLQTAGMKQQTAKEAAFAKATGGAQADIAAEDTVKGMQQGFVNTGANRYANAANQTTNAYGNIANTQLNAGSSLGNAYSNQSGMYGQQSSQQGADAGGFMKGGLDGAMDLVGLFS